MTDRAQQLLDEAAAELKLADGQQRKADDHKWAAAERMWKANKEEGVSTREIGKAVGLSHSTAQVHIRIWDQHGLEGAPSTRPPFTEAYYESTNETVETREDRAVERVLRERPEVVAEKIKAAPEASQKVVEQAAYEISVDRHERKRKAADEKFRDKVGDETADGLEMTELAQKQQSSLVNARSWLRGFNRFTTPELVEYAGDQWTEQCLEWIMEIEAEAKMARALLAGEVTDEALEAFLAN